MHAFPSHGPTPQGFHCVGVNHIFTSSLHCLTLPYFVFYRPTSWIHLKIVSETKLTTLLLELCCCMHFGKRKLSGHLSKFYFKVLISFLHMLKKRTVKATHKSKISISHCYKAGTGLHPEEEICSDLEALSIVAAALHIHLVQLNLWTIFLHLEMRITPVLAGEAYICFASLRC